MKQHKHLNFTHCELYIYVCYVFQNSVSIFLKFCIFGSGFSENKSLWRFYQVKLFRGQDYDSDKCCVLRHYWTYISSNNLLKLFKLSINLIHLTALKIWFKIIHNISRHTGYVTYVSEEKAFGLFSNWTSAQRPLSKNSPPSLHIWTAENSM